MENLLKELIQKSRQGDLKAREELIEKIIPLIIGSIKQHYYGEENLTDLIQDGCERVLISLDDFDEEKGVPFLAYIRIRLRFLYMEQRRKIRREVSLNDEIDFGDGRASFLELLVDEEANVEDALLEKEQRQILLEALWTLTDRQIKIIDMYYGEGLRMVEIAQILGVHYQTVLKARRLALMKLREKMANN